MLGSSGLSSLLLVHLCISIVFLYPTLFFYHTSTVVPLPSEFYCSYWRFCWNCIDFVNWCWTKLKYLQHYLFPSRNIVHFFIKVLYIFCSFPRCFIVLLLLCMRSFSLLQLLSSYCWCLGKPLIFFNWSTVDLQYCVSFRCPSKWFSFIYIYF